MKEIGNFFELETASFSTKLLKNKILVNSGRNALRYIIKLYKIKEVFVPAYTCQFVWLTLKEEGCEINFYHIDKNFMPTTDFDKNSYVIYSNYFGICDKQIDQLKQKYKNLIIDNAQAFYSQQMGLTSFYSIRKFFGVPDGGLVFCNNKNRLNLEKSTSYNRCIHLLKAYDKGYDTSYINFLKNELEIDKLPLQEMSNLTKALLQNINYNKAKKIRLKNFNFLHQTLKNSNELKINLANGDVPMFYPYLINNSQKLREKLKNNSIFLTDCWPQIEKYLSKYELYLKQNLILLPIDQRYGIKEMKFILKNIKF